MNIAIHRIDHSINSVRKEIRDNKVHKLAAEGSVPCTEKILRHKKDRLHLKNLTVYGVLEKKYILYIYI